MKRLTVRGLVMALALIAVGPQMARAATASFGVTGAPVNYAIPADGTARFELRGGSGGGSGYPFSGGGGGLAVWTTQVTQGTTYTFNVGGGGGHYGAYNGGGATTAMYSQNGGGGMTDMKLGSMTLLVAGGGGGAGACADSGGTSNGGAGGGTAGSNGQSPSGCSGSGGGGGSPTSGSGVMGQGGTGNSGGGGGYWGGGAGSGNAAGGGGSGYSGVSGAVLTSGVNGGNGSASITYVYGFHVTVAGTGKGGVSSSPSGISCSTAPGGGSDCDETYDDGTNVTLTETPADSSYVFNGWSGGCDSTTATTCKVSVKSAKSITANFAKAPHQLNVAASGTGSGYVDSDPAGIDCGTASGHTACSESVADGQEVTLTAHPDDASTDFAGFSGSGCTTSPCTVTMDQARSVTATFTLKQRALDASTTGDGSGYVDSSPAALDCGQGLIGHSTCSTTFAHGTQVTLTAHPDADTNFSGFGALGCADDAPSCTYTATSDQSPSFDFSLKRQPLSVTTGGTGSGYVDSDPTGIDCGRNTGTDHADCSENVVENSQVTLTAHPADNTDFAGFSGEGCTTSPCTVTADQARTVSATFTLKQRALTITEAGTGTGTVKCDGGTCASSYADGTEVELTADPADNATFDGFSGEGCTTSPCTVTMDGDRGVTATFTLKQRALTITEAGTGTGSVKCDGGTCASSYADGTQVELTADAADNANFDGFSGENCTTTTCTVTMDQDREVTATYTLKQRVLTITEAGTGTGTVKCDGGACASSYADGTQVELTADAADNANFDGFSGEGCTTSPCTVTMDGDQSVTATFTLKQRALTITEAGTGTGTVKCDGGTCASSYADGTQVELTADAADNANFDGFSGENCSTTTCTVTMDQDREVTATFTLKQRALTITKDGTGTGSVKCDGGTCASSYADGTQVELTADAADNANFDGFSGEGCTTSSCTVTMDQDRSVTATFTLKQRALTITKDGTGTGTVKCDGGTCATSYADGAQVELTADAADNANFDGFSGEGCTTSPCTVTMDGDRGVTATFTLKQRALTITKDGTGTGTVKCDGGTCASSYADGTQVELTADPDDNANFDGFSGENCSTSPCTVTMDEDREVTATFTLKQRALTITTTGNGSGTVDCDGGACAGTYTDGSQVTLAAHPAADTDFAGFSGEGCSTSPCTVTLDRDRSVTANFELKRHSATVTRDGAGSGTVTAPGIDCGTDCSEDYEQGTHVTFTATPAPGSAFLGFSGGCTSTVATCDVTIGNGPLALTARFTTPAVTTTDATGVTTSSATLNGTIDPRGAAVSYAFRYGTDANDLAVTPTRTLVAGSDPVDVSEPLPGLASGTTYVVQLVASLNDGETAGATKQFTTASLPPVVTPPAPAEPTTPVATPSPALRLTVAKRVHVRAALIPVSCKLSNATLSSCRVTIKTMSGKTIGRSSGAARVRVRLTAAGQRLAARSLAGLPVRVSGIGVPKRGNAATAHARARAFLQPNRVTTAPGAFAGFATEPTATGSGALRTLAARLSKARVARITCVGYAASVGSGADDSYAKQISLERAGAVCAVLRSAGLRARYTAKGAGKADPIGSNATDSGRSLNRRVVIEIRYR